MKKIIIVFTMLFSTLLYAELTPELYIKVDLAARLATIENLQHRIANQSGSEIPVYRIYEDYNLTPSQHAAYGTSHQQEIQNWLQNNPEWQTYYQAVQQEFEMLLQQLEY